MVYGYDPSLTQRLKASPSLDFASEPRYEGGGTLTTDNHTHEEIAPAAQWESPPDILEKRRPESSLGVQQNRAIRDSAAAPRWPRSLAQRLATFLPASHQLVCQLSALLARAILVSFSRSSLRR